ncbi:MAG: hypothetical protein Q9162_007486 [Coniocarpon cinnabarinum]
MSKNANEQHGREASKPYKIIMENVTQERKPLEILDARRGAVPRDYAFVPYGFPAITEYCKDTCRRQGVPVYMNSTYNGRASAVAKEIGRVGFFFPISTVNKAHALHSSGHRSSGLTWVQGILIYQDDGAEAASGIARRLDRHGQRLQHQNNMNRRDMEQVQVQATIRELFPKIPEPDLQAISERAFKEGAQTVGNAREIPLYQRVQLATGAHARHTYTHYDQLLKVAEWETSRAEVQKEVLDVLVRWRGEGRSEEDNAELEEFFREVIVIDSDNEDDKNDAHESHGPNSRNTPQFRAKNPSRRGELTHYSARPSQRLRHEKAPYDRTSKPHLMQDEVRLQSEPDLEPGSRLQEPQARHDLSVHPRPPMLSRSQARPMFISSAQPDEVNVQQTVEVPNKKRGASVQLEHYTASKRHHPNNQLDSRHRTNHSPSPRYWRHVNGEEVEVYDLRRPPGHEMVEPRLVDGYQHSYQDMYFYPDTDASSSHPWYQQVTAYDPGVQWFPEQRRRFVDISTGEEMYWREEYEPLPDVNERRGEPSARQPYRAGRYD